ncbi:rCG28101 [Rattus norvegicus]|uniref:RCG28101 n=1 Tax=Rattus norvegicus TaxID=10116 RepID=A6IEI4_RAT|nr:rCG28101 [Rattus norvegicus]
MVPSTGGVLPHFGNLLTASLAPKD